MCWMKLVGGLNNGKIWRYNSSPPYMMARWLPQPISTFKFPWFGHVAFNKMQECYLTSILLTQSSKLISHWSYKPNLNANYWLTVSAKHLYSVLCFMLFWILLLQSLTNNSVFFISSKFCIFYFIIISIVSMVIIFIVTVKKLNQVIMTQGEASVLFR